MLRYWGVIVQVISGARLAGLHRRAHLVEQFALRGQELAFEIAQDDVDLHLGCGPAHPDDVKEALAAGSRLWRERGLGQRVHDLGGQVRGVDQLVFGPAGMDRHALDVDLRRVGRKGLVDDLAQMRAVERVGEVGLEIARQVGMHAAADLLVRREADANRTVRQIWVLHQVARRGHDDGDTGLVVRAQQRRAGCGHDIVAHFLSQIGQRLGRQHLAGIVGQDDVLAVVAAMDDRLDVRAGKLGGGVHMRQQGDRGRPASTVAGMDARTAP